MANLEFSRSLLRVAIAQICQNLGWHAVQSTPMEMLTDILERYTQELGRMAHRYSEQFGRTEPNLDDLGLAFRDLGVSLGELSEYVRHVEPIPFVMDVPKFPVTRPNCLHFPKPNSRELLQREEHIHEHLPPMNPQLDEEIVVPTPMRMDQGLGGPGMGYMTKLGIKEEPPMQSTPGAPPGVEKRQLTSPSETTPPPVKRPKLLPDEAAHSKYEMQSVIMSGGFVCPMRGQGKLPDASTPPNVQRQNSFVVKPGLARSSSTLADTIEEVAAGDGFLDDHVDMDIMAGSIHEGTENVPPKGSPVRTSAKSPLRTSPVPVKAPQKTAKSKSPKGGSKAKSPKQNKSKAKQKSKAKPKAKSPKSKPKSPRPQSPRTPARSKSPGGARAKGPKSSQSSMSKLKTLLVTPVMTTDMSQAPQPKPLLQSESPSPSPSPPPVVVPSQLVSKTKKPSSKNLPVLTNLVSKPRPPLPPELVFVDSPGRDDDSPEPKLVIADDEAARQRTLQEEKEARLASYDNVIDEVIHRSVRDVDRQEEEERQRELKRLEELEREEENRRQQELEREEENRRQQELESRRQEELEREKQLQLERERERQRQLEREIERQREYESEVQRQKEREREQEKLARAASIEDSINEVIRKSQEKPKPVDVYSFDEPDFDEESPPPIKIPSLPSPKSPKKRTKGHKKLKIKLPSDMDKEKDNDPVKEKLKEKIKLKAEMKNISPVWPKVSLERITPEEIEEMQKFEYPSPEKAGLMVSPMMKAAFLPPYRETPPAEFPAIQPLTIDIGSKEQPKIKIKTNFGEFEKWEKKEKKKKNKDKDKEKVKDKSKNKERSKDKKKSKDKSKRKNKVRGDPMVPLSIPKLTFKFGPGGTATSTMTTSSTTQHLAAASQPPPSPPRQPTPPPPPKPSPPIPEPAKTDVPKLVIRPAVRPILDVPPPPSSDPFWAHVTKSASKSSAPKPSPPKPMPPKVPPKPVPPKIPPKPRTPTPPSSPSIPPTPSPPQIPASAYKSSSSPSPSPPPPQPAREPTPPPPPRKSPSPSPSPPPQAAVPTPAPVVPSNLPPPPPSKAAQTGKATKAGKGSKAAEKLNRTVITETVGTIVDEVTGDIIWICPSCKMQDDGSPMIGCDSCDDWYHWVCVGIKIEPAEEEQWFCPRCNANRNKKKKGRRKKKD